METEQPLSRKEREKIVLKQQRKDEILAVAEELFIRNGYARTTIEDIAKRADFSVGSIYSFFGGKADIIHEVAHRIFRLYIGDLEEKVVPLQNDFNMALPALVHICLTHHFEHGDFLRLVHTMDEASRHELSKSEQLDRMVDKKKEWAPFFNKIHLIFEGIFESARSQGVTKDLSAFDIQIIFQGVLRAYVFTGTALHPEMTSDREAFEDKLVKIFKKIICS